MTYVPVESWLFQPSSILRMILARSDVRCSSHDVLDCQYIQMQLFLAISYTLRTVRKSIKGSSLSWNPIKLVLLSSCSLSHFLSGYWSLGRYKIYFGPVNHLASMFKYGSILLHHLLQSTLCFDGINFHALIDVNSSISAVLNVINCPLIFLASIFNYFMSVLQGWA